ncbi:MAG: efflux RND transporter permease subunit [Cyclobacteriaceae bacterium]
MINNVIKYFLENKLVTVLLLVGLVVWGIISAPFGWNLGSLPSDPVPVDAIPDIGENQQIVFTQWQGRSPQDIEDQITYPLTTSLLGIPGVKSIRSSSIFGFSSIYVIFSEDIEFYWSRSRILEKLSSLPSGLLPEGVQPTLGPDATALGQVFWYTIEGRDLEGNPTGGWDLHEIRSVQDFYVKYGLNAVEGVSEVASIGGFVQEYQVDVNPDALKAYNVGLHQVMNAVRQSNRDVGAKTIELNKAEYLVRGLGYIKSVEDIEKAVVTVNDNVPIRIKDVAVVTLGPATRRGVLDKDGAEAVGGVVVARYGSNPLQVINAVKAKIDEIASGLPKKTLVNGKVSQLTIVPFYDRSQLIHETLGTLEEALSLEILISILVVIVMVFNLRASLLISSILPISVLIVFIAMRQFGVDANIVALSGIAIAIGTMVDLGIILSENILKKLEEAKESVDDGDERLEASHQTIKPSYYQTIKSSVYEGAAEVSSAIVTAVATTIISFIPVFTLQAAEGKLFGPLAFTKTFALAAALIVSLLILPTLAHWFFGFRLTLPKFIRRRLKNQTEETIDNQTTKPSKYRIINKVWRHRSVIIALVAALYLLAKYWLPLGPDKTLFVNFIFVSLLVGLILGIFTALEYFYKPILIWCLNHKKIFLIIPSLLILFGLNIWLGFSTVFSLIDDAFDSVGINVKTNNTWSKLAHTFPGIGEEFMPSLDEGSFLLMPTSMPHSGVDYNRQVLGLLDMSLTNIPEVDLTVGKLGRVESALDPAPISMFENVINYKSEYAIDQKGHRRRFRIEDDLFVLESGEKLSNEEILVKGIDIDQLIPDDDGRYFRNWRSAIKTPDDIWDEIVGATKIPGVTSAPKLQPIETRLVMLQTGMRAPMGIKVYGPDLQTIQDFGLKLEDVLKTVPSVKSEAVFADRIVGKPYLHLNIDRDKISRYGLSIDDMQQTIETAIGGMKITSTVEGRERFPVRVRYPRELRDDPESLGKILVPTPSGAQIPLSQLVDFEYMRGPQAIKSEETFLVGYVLFDKRDGYAEVDVVNDANRAIQDKIKSGELIVPTGINYKFSGSYENQVRAEKRLMIIVPIVLALVFLILYFQFNSVSTSLMVFSGIAMAFSGGFILIWLYGQGWFGDFTLFETNLRDLFQMKTINLSVAVWVGFIALFGIATDDGVLIATYLDQSFRKNKPSDIDEVRGAVVEAGLKRIKPALMTVSTTMIALLPVLTSTGRGADIMIPMAIPSFGGMAVALVSIFIVPVIYCWREERKIKTESK